MSVRFFKKAVAFLKRAPQKTFDLGHGMWRRQRPQGSKSFLPRFFSKKRVLSSPASGAARGLLKHPAWLDIPM
jgi:hypothetical protein